MERSCCDESGSRVDSAASEIDGHGHHQCGDSSGVIIGSATDRHRAADQWMENGFAAGAVGIAWVIWWSVSYRGSSTASIDTLDIRLVAQKLSFLDIVGMRKVQVLVFAKFMSDSAWYFYLFWLPKYLYDVRGFDVKHVSYYAWIPYAASGVGSFLGGWLSSNLLSRGRSLDFSRKFVLGLSALFMPVVVFGAARTGGLGAYVL